MKVLKFLIQVCQNCQNKVRDNMRDIDTCINRVKVDLPLTNEETNAVRVFLDKKIAGQEKVDAVMGTACIVATFILSIFLAVGYFNDWFA